MTFLLSSTFTDSLARLRGDEQKAVKTTVFDLQVNIANPGLSFHKLDRARDKRFWSVRVSDDLRIIVHKSEASLLVCYVDHHDKAYAWAEKRRLETHPITGAAQIIEVRESIEDVRIPVYESAERRPFEHIGDAELLGYGVPPDWLSEIRLATEDSLLTIAEHLPSEAAEALLELATGGKPTHPKAPASAAAEAEPSYGSLAPFFHPDAQRRFRVMASVEELERALDYPWEKWSVFLHPDQRELVEGEYGGPFRVSGSAGTGKTVVALHRAVHLARRHPDARVLLTTFSDPLANALVLKLRALAEHEPRLGERVDIRALPSLARRLATSSLGRPKLAGRGELTALLAEAAKACPEQSFGLSFLYSEWSEIVDAWQVESREAYRLVPRLGRKTRLSEGQRDRLWSIFEKLRGQLRDRNLQTEAELFTSLARSQELSASPIFDFIVVDEAQDLSVAQLRFLAALGKHRPDALFFAGDLGQRIFQQPFSWKALGLDVRGRSRTLEVNYRTSHQIRSLADRLLGSELVDVDGNVEKRGHTISVLNGPAPTISLFDSETEEQAAIAAWIEARKAEGFRAEEFGIFVRSQNVLERALGAATKAGLPAHVLDDRIEFEESHASIGTMDLAKGLEFRAVVVLACDDEVLPLEARIEAVGDESDLDEVYNTERQLLYVACTRARDWLLVTGVKPGSEFLDDLR
jgi:mRNA-degrading endonuclease RelE of RelBE toxin-antitoxin system